MSTTVAPRRARRYTAEQVELGLQAVAKARGNARYARELLKELDPPVDVPDSTLKGWINKHHVVRYEEIRAAEQADTQSRAALQVEDALALVLQRELEILTLMDPTQIPKPDLPKALREVSTPLGILADKSFMLRDKALPGPAPKLDVDGTLRSLEALGVVKQVDVIEATYMEEK
jgi:hypothetical protein